MAAFAPRAVVSSCNPCNREGGPAGPWDARNGPPQAAMGADLLDMIGRS